MAVQIGCITRYGYFGYRLYLLPVAESWANFLYKAYDYFFYYMGSAEIALQLLSRPVI